MDNKCWFGAFMENSGHLMDKSKYQPHNYIAFFNNQPYELTHDTYTEQTNIDVMNFFAIKHSKLKNTCLL
jgi:hypothetical protein